MAGTSTCHRRHHLSEIPLPEIARQEIFGNLGINYAPFLETSDSYLGVRRSSGADDAGSTQKSESPTFFEVIEQILNMRARI